MSEITFQVARGRMRVVRDAFQDILAKSKEALESYEAQDMVEEISSAAASVLRVVSRRTDSLKPESTPFDIACSHSAGCLLADTLRLVERTEKFAASFERKGYSIEGLDNLRSIHRELKGFTDDFAKRWMLPDAEKLKMSRQQIAEGKFRVL